MIKQIAFYESGTNATAYFKDDEQLWTDYFDIEAQRYRKLIGFAYKRNPRFGITNVKPTSYKTAFDINTLQTSEKIPENLGNIPYVVFECHC